MGERLPYKQRVTGSSPVSSIEPLAQLVEQLTFNQWVDSSSLSRLRELLVLNGGSSRHGTNNLISILFHAEVVQW